MLSRNRKPNRSIIIVQKNSSTSAILAFATLLVVFGAGFIFWKTQPVAKGPTSTKVEVAVSGPRAHSLIASKQSPSSQESAAEVEEPRPLSPLHRNPASTVKPKQSERSPNAQQPDPVTNKADEERRLLEKIALEANGKCLVCGGSGKVPAARELLEAGLVKEAGCIFCSKGKPVLEIKPVMAADLVEARKNGTLQLNVGYLVFGRVKKGGMSEHWDGWLEFEGPGSLHSVKCLFSLASHPGVADALDKIESGDTALIQALLVSYEKTMNTPGSVVLSECRILHSEKK